MMKNINVLSLGFFTASLFFVLTTSLKAQFIYKDTAWVNATIYDHISIPEHVFWPAKLSNPCSTYTEFNMYAPRSVNTAITGMVADTLDSDNKPVKSNFVGTPSPDCKRGEPGYCPGCGWYNRDMDKWFRNGSNVAVIPIKLPFVHQGKGVYHYRNWNFYPLDTLPTSLTNTGKEKLNVRTNHNLGFCMEVKTTFRYNATTDSLVNLNFVGDDDIWVFINKRLVLDGGAVHLPVRLNFNLKTEATRLGLVSGNTYPMDIFYCERRELESRLEFTTNMPIFGSKLKYNLIR